MVKRFALVLCLALAAVGGRAAGTTGEGGVDAERATGRDKALANHLTERAEALLERYEVPGASLALLEGGRVTLESGLGATAAEQGGPVTARTTFQVASLSKPVTALGVLLLAEQGELDLDRPVSAYLRRWQLPDSSWELDRVTARRLLSHRGGTNIHGYPGLPPDRPLPSLEESLEGENGGAGPVRLEHEPGERVAYSSGGYTVLQLLVEEVSGRPFAEFMRERVLEPLGMTSSSFEGRATDSAAIGHGWWGDAVPSYRFRAQAASGLVSTAGDLARFLAVLHDDELQQRVGISSRLLAEMMEPPSGHRTGFGLGFALEAVSGVKLVSHTGANRGWKSIFGAAPGTGDGVVVLTNSDRGLPLTTDLLCEWGQRTVGAELASCWVERKSRGTLLAVALLLGAGVAMEAWAFAGRRRRQAVRWSGRERYPWLAWTRLVLSILILGLWWVFWYTEIVVVMRDGIRDIIPVSSVPPTFFWVTVVLTAWCLLGVARWLWAVAPSRPAATV
jgi:CubicO group peptidase (beta-lactamase class C family)